MPTLPIPPHEYTTDEESRFRRYLEQQLSLIEGKLTELELQAQPGVETQALLTKDAGFIFTRDGEQVMTREGGR